MADDAGVIDRDEAIGQMIDQLLDGRMLALFRCQRRPGRWSKLQQKHMARFRRHQGSPQHPGPGVGAEMHEDAQGLAALTNAREHLADGVAVFRRHVMKQFAAGQIFVAAARRIQCLDRGAVGFNDPQIGGRHDDDGLVGSLEHQPIARLDFPEFPVIALHGLLGCDQARLQLGNRLQILTDREHAGATAEQHRGVFHRNFQAARKTLIDLAESRNPADAGVVDHALDLVAAHFTGDFDPRATKPTIDALAAHRWGQRRLADNAFHVQQKRDVGLYGR